MNWPPLEWPKLLTKIIDGIYGNKLRDNWSQLRLKWGASSSDTPPMMLFCVCNQREAVLYRCPLQIDNLECLAGASFSALCALSNYRYNRLYFESPLTIEKGELKNWAKSICKNILMTKPHRRWRFEEVKKEWNSKERKERREKKGTRGGRKEDWKRAPRAHDAVWVNTLGVNWVQPRTTEYFASGRTATTRERPSWYLTVKTILHDFHSNQNQSCIKIYFNLLGSRFSKHWFVSLRILSSKCTLPVYLAPQLPLKPPSFPNFSIEPKFAWCVPPTTQLRFSTKSKN